MKRYVGGIPPPDTLEPKFEHAFDEVDHWYEYAMCRGLVRLNLSRNRQS